MVEKYQLLINGQLVTVSRDIYKAYYNIKNHFEYLKRTDKKNGLVLFSDLDTMDTVGEAAIPDLCAVDVEELAIKNIQKKKLRQYLRLLEPEDQSLIKAIYFVGLSEREYAKRIGISQNAVNKRRHRAILKLKKFFEE